MDPMKGEAYLRSVLDAFPSPVLVVDRDLRIYDQNRTAREWLGGGEVQLKRLCGDVLHCLFARDADAECGTTEFCADCVLRQTAEAVDGGELVVRRASKMRLEQNGEDRDVWLLVTGAPLRYGNRNLAIVTLEDITEVAELHTLVPICAHCHKVRDDADYWQQVEEYLAKYTRMRFSHGICPACLDEHYPEVSV